MQRNSCASLSNLSTTGYVGKIKNNRLFIHLVIIIQWPNFSLEETFISVHLCLIHFLFSLSPPKYKIFSEVYWKPARRYAPFYLSPGISFMRSTYWKCVFVWITDDNFEFIMQNHGIEALFNACDKHDSFGKWCIFSFCQHTKQKNPLTGKYINLYSNVCLFIF